MQQTRRNVLIMGILGMLILGGAIFFKSSEDDSSLFSWDTVTLGEIQETISVSGEIRAKNQINIGTSVLGEIIQLHVADGQDVKTGDLLVTIDQEKLKQALAQGIATLDSSITDRDRLNAVYSRAEEYNNRIESLFRLGLVSDEDLRQSKLARDVAKLAAKSAQANVAQNEANVAGLRDGLSKSVLRAPISGRVTGLKAQKGETAIPGFSNLPGATLMIISDMSEMIAEVNVNESEVVHIKEGQEAQVLIESLPGSVFRGKVYQVATGSEANATQGNLYKVKILLTSPLSDVKLLRPGMNARAVILTAGAKTVLRVPLQAVLERQTSIEEARRVGLLAPIPQSVVMVYKNGHAEEVKGTIGVANNQYCDFKANLTEGCKVITGPSKKLKELKDKNSIKLRSLSDTQLAARPKEAKP